MWQEFAFQKELQALVAYLKLTPLVPALIQRMYCLRALPALHEFSFPLPPNVHALAGAD